MADPRQGLTGTIAVFAATVATLFGLALTGEERPTQSRAGEEPPPELLDPERLLELGVERTPRVARRVEAIRELEFDDLPEPRLSSSARLRRLTGRQLEKARVKRELAIADAELLLLGLLEEGQRLDDLAADVTALASAYYDPRSERLFLVGDAVPAGAESAESVLAHELTHALEDQRFGLPDRVDVADDRMLAEDALVEGTATEVAFSYDERHLDPIALAAQSTGVDTSALDELPRFALAEVRFVYLEGARFVSELLDLGKDWALVDYAWQRQPPATTEQVIHVDKYLDDERALPVSAPQPPGRGWRVLDTGVLGEFGTRELLREGEAGIGADEGAAGWGGDRYRLFARAGAGRECTDECRLTHAFGIVWRGDDDKEARELAAGLRRYLRVALGGEREGAGTWALEPGWAALTAVGDRVALGLAPTAAVARRIASTP